MEWGEGSEGFSHSVPVSLDKETNHVPSRGDQSLDGTSTTLGSYKTMTVFHDDSSTTSTVTMSNLKFSQWNKVGISPSFNDWSSQRLYPE